MVRAIDGVVQGNWYWECEILDTDKADAHFRWGFADMNACIAALKPVRVYIHLRGLTLTQHAHAYAHVTS
eukprot:38847-Eustigmatos_ZCMA.PRE.1